MESMTGPWQTKKALETIDANVADEEDKRIAKMRRYALKVDKMHVIEYAIWVVVSVIFALVYQIYWVPQNDWTIAIKWVILLAILTNLVYSVVSFIRSILFYGDMDKVRY